MDVQRHSEAFQLFQTMKIIKTKAPCFLNLDITDFFPWQLVPSNQKQNLCLKVTFE